MAPGPLKQHGVFAEPVERRSSDAAISVRRQMIGTQSIDRDQDDRGRLLLAPAGDGQHNGEKNEKNAGPHEKRADRISVRPRMTKCQNETRAPRRQTRGLSRSTMWLFCGSAPLATNRRLSRHSTVRWFVALNRSSEMLRRAALVIAKS